MSPFDSPVQDTTAERAGGALAAWVPPHSRAAALRREVEALEEMELEGLREAWRRRFGEAPPLRSPELLRLMLAFRLQAAVWGGLDAEVRQRLRQTRARPSAETALPPGLRLTREWKGVAETVEALGDEYAWRGQRFASLSAAARAITGTRWNGPRFFGLRDGGERR